MVFSHFILHVLTSGSIGQIMLWQQQTVPKAQWLLFLAHTTYPVWVRGLGRSCLLQSLKAPLQYALTLGKQCGELWSGSQKFLPRSDACHFHSHFIGQSEWLYGHGLTAEQVGIVMPPYAGNTCCIALIVSTVSIMKNMVNTC